MLEFARAAATGLTDTPRWLPCQYLYDARGSALFEQITRQPEYYQTRAEAVILANCAPAIREETGDVTLIELGSGNSEKTGYLLEAYTSGDTPVRYVPVDVSAAALRQASERLAVDHPGVDVSGLVGRYEEAFPLFREYSPSVVVFLGSTIGNFNNGESLRFWRSVATHMADGDYFLLGVDLVKDPAVLEAAYNDAAGVTAEFTKNLFARMNRELESGLDLNQLEHVARYSEEWQRMEIFVRFVNAQSVHIEPIGATVAIDAGEQVMVEISRKFVLAHLATYLSIFGLQLRNVFTDAQEWFAVLLLQKSGVQS